MLIPFLVFSLAPSASIPDRVCGQLSLGTGGFMAVGAYACYKITTIFPGPEHPRRVPAVGLFSAGRRGPVRPAESLRIKGFYLAVATLAAQFFLVWLFNKVAWFYNYNPRAPSTAPPREARLRRSP